MPLDKSIFKNYIWRMGERIGAQGVAFVVSIVLARLLDPDAYGLIAIVNVFINFTSIFVDSGFSSALIQKKDADDLDFSSVFVFNIISSIVLYGVIFLISPLVASFYKMPQLKRVLRVLGIVIVVSAFKSVQIAYVSKRMEFKLFFFATLAGTVGAGVIGIVFAYKGYGIWALVAQHVFNTVVDTLVLLLMVKWRPQFRISISRLKVLFSYGWKLLATSFFSLVYYETRQLAIGKVYSSSQLAYFNKGETFPGTMLKIINTSLGSIIFPAMSNEQDDITRVKKIAQNTIEVSSFLLTPALLGLAACANNLITLILTEKWLPAASFMQIYCVTYCMYPIRTANSSACQALGRSDLTLKFGLTNDAICLITLMFTLKRGVKIIALSMLLTMFVSLIVDSSKSKELFDYSFWEQIKDIMPTVISASAMAGIVWFIGERLHLHIALELLIQISSGVVIYFLFAIIFKNKYIYDILHKLKTRGMKSFK